MCARARTLRLLASPFAYPAPHAWPDTHARAPTQRARRTPVGCARLLMRTCGASLPLSLPSDVDGSIPVQKFFFLQCSEIRFFHKNRPFLHKKREFDTTYSVKTNICLLRVFLGTPILKKYFPGPVVTRKAPGSMQLCEMRPKIHLFVPFCRRC